LGLKEYGTKKLNNKNNSQLIKKKIGKKVGSNYLIKEKIKLIELLIKKN